MIPSNYVTIWIAYANAFIALFIMVYAYLFLKKTNEHHDRRPWDFLFVASFLYFIFQIFNIAYISGITFILGNTLNINMISNLFAFLYSGSVLLAFVSQHDLILKSELILISKKDEQKESEAKVNIGGKKK